MLTTIIALLVNMKSTVKLLIAAVMSLFLQCRGQVILLDKSQTFDVGPGDRRLLSVDFGSDSYNHISLGSTRVKETLVIQTNLVSSPGPVHMTAVSLDKSRGWKLEDKDISAVTLCVDKVTATDKPSVSNTYYYMISTNMMKIIFIRRFPIVSGQ